MMRFLPLTRHQRRRLSTNITAAWHSSRAAGEPLLVSLRKPFLWYSNKLDTHPILTKCASAALIASIGNVCAQKITHTRRQKTNQGSENEENLQVDWSSVGRFAFLNAAYVAPVLHYWYQFVNKAFPGSTVKAVCTRVFWDEFVFTPMYLPVFMGSLWSMEGTEWERVQHMLINEMPSIIVAEWALWVPTMAITFRYAPVKYQVLVINLVGVGWQTFLSLMAEQAHTKHDGACTPEKKTKQPKAEKATTLSPDGFLKQKLR